jgi:hypothetical protein
MNCEKCQELISDFLDGALSDVDHKMLDAHLEDCLSCDSVREELESIVTYCRDHRGVYEVPPNERAMWLRIRNTIESQPTGLRALAAAGSSTTGQTLNWLTRLFNRQWELSFSQMAAAVAVIAIIVSLVTVIGMRGLQPGRTNSVADTTDSNRSGSSTRYALNGGTLDERLARQQEVIDGWNKIIEQRKVIWSRQTREAFDRNLLVVDQAVLAFREELKRNPHDQLSAEMLDAAMTDKMELLSSFAEL